MLTRISPKEAHKLQGEGWTYLDVRSTEEFANGHPEGAVNIPFLNNSPNGLVPNPDFLKQVSERFEKDTPLVVGCWSGGRSVLASEQLIGAGYSKLVEQRCGFGGARDSEGNVVEAGWRESGLPCS